MEVYVECPSGLCGYVRGLKISELDDFANMETVRSRKIGDKVLGVCWTRTESVPPCYPELREKFESDPESFKLDWKDVLVCDRFYTMTKIREAGGPNAFEYDAKFRCSGQSGCGEHFDRRVDLKQLPVFDLPEESADLLARGENAFSFLLDENTRVHHKLLFSRDLDKLESRKRMTKGEQATTTLMARLLMVEQLVDGEWKKIESGDLRRWVRDLPAGAWFKIQQELDEVDGGVDTEVELVCPHCGNRMEQDLPFGLDSMIPEQPKRSGRRKARQRR
jgi:hypothetical protein